MKNAKIVADLKALRYERGYTQREWAAALGVHYRTVEGWEANRASPVYGRLILNVALALPPCTTRRENWRQGPKRHRPHRKRGATN